MSKLRGKLEAAMPDRRFIHTHPGFGYRFQPQPSTGGAPPEGGARRAQLRPRRRRSAARETPAARAETGFHEMFTWKRPGIRRDWTAASTDRQGAPRPRERPWAVDPAHNPAEETLVIKNKIGALAGVVVLALGLAACGSSSSS